jgi:hypothetical protein
MYVFTTMHFRVLGKLIVKQLVKKFSAFRGTRQFIILVPVLSQVNPVHTFPCYFAKIHSNIFLSMPRSSNWSLPFRFSNKNIVSIIATMHAT